MRNILLSICSLFVILSGNIVTISDVYAEDMAYPMINDVTPVLTFTFRDGVETHEFPVFKMTENLVLNSGTSFYVEGVVTNSPLLHKTMDEAYKYRLSNGAFDYQFKYFDVDADFVKDGESITMLDYDNCFITDYQVDTLSSDDYESYMLEVGFAVIDKLNFQCSGVNLTSDTGLNSTNNSFTEFGSSGYNFAHDMHPLVTFSFKNGMETIEFPVFKLISGYGESGVREIPEFAVEGTLSNYPLLFEAVNNSRNVSGIGSSSNVDFNALVEFTDGEKILRGFVFTDCIVSNAIISTQTDGRKGYTGEGTFAIVNQFNFKCSGIDGVNMYYNSLRDDSLPTWRQSHVTNTYDEPIGNFVHDIRAVTTFTFNNGVEVNNFSIFSQNSVLSNIEATSDAAFTKKSVYPGFKLKGAIGDYPMLYKFVDDNRHIQGVSGTLSRNLFDVDVDLMDGNNILRGFNYSNCRSIDYSVETETADDESYKEDFFAVVNVFDFECQGYHPNNPTYDVMFDVEKAHTLSTTDLRITDDWAKGFYVE